MASKKYFVDINLQSNKVDNLKADTLDITTNLASANPKRIVYYNNDYYYSDGTNWVLMTNVVPNGGTTGQVLAKATNTDYDLEWVDQTGGGGIPFAIASGTDTYSATITGVTAYNDGDAYLIRFTNGNTTTCTLNINSIGDIALYTNNDGALIGGDIASGGQMLCVYNSTLNCFQTIGTSPNTLVSYVTNADSVTLTKGMPVYAYGGTGDRMTVKRASNLGDPTSAQTVGLVLSTSIGVNQKGFIMMQGLLQNLSILPTSTFADGDAIYLGATPGTITNVKPYAPNHLVYLGTVTTASNGNAGRMYVRVQNGYELQELHNVSINSSTLANNNLLAYDSTAQLWENKTITTVIGYTPANQSTTISTTSPLSGGGDLSTNRTLSISQANGSTNGYLSSTDWTTFNSKQNALNGTGFVKISGTTISYDNSTYLTAAIISLNSLTGATQTFATGTSGSDFGISSAGTTHTFNLPTASATVRGALSSADWTTFNSKQGAIILTTTGTSGAATLIGNTLNIPQYSSGGGSGTVTSIATSSPITGGTITTSGTIGISQSTTSTDGYLSSTDWNTFNNKVSTSRTITINGTSQDLSADRTFTITDANLSTSDITTNNVSTTKHGFAPKLPNDATKYLDGTGAYSDPLSSTSWIDYSSTSTVVGWSSFTTKKIRYRVIGKQLFVNFEIYGISNSTSTTFTLPFNNVNGVAIVNGMYAANNGTNVRGMCVTTLNSNVLTLYQNESATWTASGTKYIYGQFFYEIA